MQKQIHETFLTAIQTLYNKTPPRMQLTNRIAQVTMERINLTNESINEILEKRRRQLIDIVHEKEQKLCISDV